MKQGQLDNNLQNMANSAKNIFDKYNLYNVTVKNRQIQPKRC